MCCKASIFEQSNGKVSKVRRCYGRERDDLGSKQQVETSDEVACSPASLSYLLRSAVPWPPFLSFQVLFSYCPSLPLCSAFPSLTCMEAPCCTHTRSHLKLEAKTASLRHQLTHEERQG